MSFAELVIYFELTASSITTYYLILILRQNGWGWALCWVAHVAVKDSHNNFKEEGKVYKAHLWQRLGQDEDKEREDEEDEVM